MRVEDVFAQFQQGFGGQQSYSYDSIPADKLDKFIDQCKRKEDMNNYMLAQELHRQLQQNPLTSIEFQAIIPHVIKHLQMKIQRGED